jgi:hypothetical protein
MDTLILLTISMMDGSTMLLVEAWVLVSRANPIYLQLQNPSTRRFEIEIILI